MMSDVNMTEVTGREGRLPIGALIARTSVWSQGWRLCHW
jgi:hypothetical protein